MPRPEQPTVDRLATLVRAHASEESPAARLGVAIEISDACDALIERFVAEARATGMSWTEIGQVFGTSKQAAQKRYGATQTPKGGQWPGRWAPAARHALDLGTEEARQLGHNYVGTEHVLLGLAAAADGLAAHALSDLGVTRERVLAVDCIGVAGAPRPYDALGVQPRLKQAIELSWRVADGLGHRVANTEHLLAGLVAVPDALAVEILRRLGVSADDVRDRLARRLEIDEQQLVVARRRRRRLVAKRG